jgi:small-conductance mechanosensitive channel
MSKPIITTGHEGVDLVLYILSLILIAAIPFLIALKLLQRANPSYKTINFILLIVMIALGVASALAMKPTFFP